MNIWIKTVFGLLVVWLAAFGIIHSLRASKPTAKSVRASLARIDISREQGRDRARAIAALESQLNDVSFEDRQNLRRDGELRHFFLSLTTPEQEAFLDATLPTGFKQIMEAFNKMGFNKRRKFVAHAVEDMQKHADEDHGPPPGMDPKITEHFINQGLRSFYKDASPDTKLDLAPLIEQMQRNLQMGAQE